MGEMEEAGEWADERTEGGWRGEEEEKRNRFPVSNPSEDKDALDDIISAIKAQILGLQQ
jgi:hypothetical protein